MGEGRIAAAQRSLRGVAGGFSTTPVLLPSFHAPCVCTLGQGDVQPGAEVAFEEQFADVLRPKKENSSLLPPVCLSSTWPSYTG